PDPLMRRMDLTFQVGAEVTADAMFSIGDLHLGAQKTFSATFNAGCTWQPATGTQCRTGGSSPNTAISSSPKDGRSAGQNSSVAVSLIDHGYERFGEYAAFSNQDRAPVTSTSNDANLPVTVTESTLVSNLFPGAAPNLAQAGFGRMLLWEQQDATLPTLQSTDIAWSYYDGGTWTTPALIAHDTKAELSPVMGVDSSGRVVAAWLRIKDDAFTSTIPTADD